MKLRDYQERAVTDLRARYQAGFKAPCLCMPTGGGKTPTASEIIRLALQKGQRVGFLANRVELLAQARRKLADAGITDVRYIQAENDNQSTSPLFLASIPTLASSRWRGQLPPADFLIFDEVHHLRAQSWMDLAQSYKTARLLGLTATPQRGDGKGLAPLLDCIVVGATVKQLQDLGHLVPCKLFAPPDILKTREIALDPLTAYERYTPGQRVIVFAQTVQHAREIAASFNARSINAEWISGSSKNREEVLERFARSEFMALINVQVLVEGFDDPGIEAAILARRFTYVGGYLQAIGRTLRPAPRKLHATVVDLCGSALVHGTPDLDRKFTLDGRGITNDRVSIRQCQECGGVYEDAPKCPYCAFQTPPLQRTLPKSKNLKLEQVDSTKPLKTWLPKIKATRSGTCPKCQQRIATGDLIIYDKSQEPSKRARHSLCPLAEAA